MQLQSFTSGQEDEIIRRIIFSFETFAFGDIRFNIKEKPISAFILCSCLIDQLAAFRYNHGLEDNKFYYNEFIKAYLPQYRGLNLYINLRCKLVHGYTVGNHIAITSEDVILENLGMGKNVNLINAKLLFKDLEDAFKLFCAHLRDKNSDARTNAINCYSRNNILSISNYIFELYTEEVANTLIRFYKKKVIGKLMNGNPYLKINRISKSLDTEKGLYFVYVNATYANQKYSVHILEHYCPVGF